MSGRSVSADGVSGVVPRAVLFGAVARGKPRLTWREKLGPDWLDEHPYQEWMPYVVITYLLIGSVGTIVELGHARAWNHWWTIVMSVATVLAYVAFAIHRARRGR